MNTPNQESREAWLLAHVNDPAVPAAAMADILDGWQAAGQAERAQSAADLVIEAMIARRDEPGLVALLTRLAAWHAGEAPYPFASTCAKHLIACCQKDAAALALIPQAGFTKNVPAAECLRRFACLRRLKPGALCYEKTWGFGVVRGVDTYDHQAVIDFDQKPAHRMALAYAAETLQMLDENHLLARRHRDPAAFSAWLKEDPAGAVLCALASFGPLTAAALQDQMAGLLGGPQGWKPFWDAARKRLKQHPLVDFPAKRTEPLRLLDTQKRYDDAWRRSLLEMRDAEKILQAVGELADAEIPDAERGAMLEAAADRLDFAILGTLRRHPGQAAQAGLLAHELGVAGRLAQRGALLETLFQDAVFMDALREIPARRLKPFLGFLLGADADRLFSLLYRLLPDLPLSALNETAEFLTEAGQKDRLLETLRSLMASGRAGCEILYWLCRRPALAQAENLGSPGALALAALAAVENPDLAGERLKARNQLCGLFELPAWLGPALDSLDADQRGEFMRRLKDSPAWPPVDRRAICGRVLKLHPELSVYLQDDVPPPAARAPRLTSIRSYRERLAQRDRLVAEEIPKNSHDIAVARSYGDLRENFEYKSAKETQGILLRRKAELDAQLDTVKSTDFGNVPMEAAGPGTRVRVRAADGHEQAWHLLGEWDSDERLGIIASQCKLGQALTGRRPGDTFEFPDGTTGTLLEVEGLPDAIRAWVRGEA